MKEANTLIELNHCWHPSPKFLVDLRNKIQCCRCGTKSNVELTNKQRVLGHGKYYKKDQAVVKDKSRCRISRREYNRMRNAYPSLLQRLQNFNT